MDFWICQHLESEGGNFTAAPAFRSCADKMAAYLLDLVGRPKCPGIRPHSLKVATIHPLKVEVVKGHANLSQLATRGNYRACAAQNTAEIYSRNVAQQQISVSDFAQNAFQVDKSQGSIGDVPPVFSGNTPQCEVEAPESEFEGANRYDWDIKLLGARKMQISGKEAKGICAYRRRQK